MNRRQIANPPVNPSLRPGRGQSWVTDTLRQRVQTGLPARIEQRLQEGAAKARALAIPFLGELRQAIGVRNLALGIPSTVTARPKAPT